MWQLINHIGVVDQQSHGLYSSFFIVVFEQVFAAEAYLEPCSISMMKLFR